MAFSLSLATNTGWHRSIRLAPLRSCKLLSAATAHHPACQEAQHQADDQPDLYILYKKTYPDPDQYDRHYSYPFSRLHLYLFFGRPMRFASNLYAPGLPAGSCLNNTRLTYAKFPFPYLVIARLPFIGFSPGSAIVSGIS